MFQSTNQYSSPWFLGVFDHIPATWYQFATKKHAQNVGGISFAAKDHGHGRRFAKFTVDAKAAEGGHQKRNG